MKVNLSKKEVDAILGFLFHDDFMTEEELQITASWDTKNIKRLEGYLKITTSLRKKLKK